MDKKKEKKKMIRWEKEDVVTWWDGRMCWEDLAAAWGLGLDSYGR